jgi:hypothetical protein
VLLIPHITYATAQRHQYLTFNVDRFAVVYQQCELDVLSLTKNRVSSYVRYRTEAVWFSDKVRQFPAPDCVVIGLVFGTGTFGTNYENEFSERFSHDQKSGYCLIRGKSG